MPHPTNLSQRLRCLRSRCGYTQEQFAEQAGLSYKFYQQIESGRKKQIWLETVKRLAAGFGLEAWQLLAPEEPEPGAAVAEPAAQYRTGTGATKKAKKPKKARKAGAAKRGR